MHYDPIILEFQGQRIVFDDPVFLEQFYRALSARGVSKEEFIHTALAEWVQQKLQEIAGST